MGAQPSRTVLDTTCGPSTQTLSRRVSLFLLSLCVLGVLYALLFEPAESEQVIFPTLCAAAGGYAIAYAIACTRHRHLSVGLLIAVQLATPSSVSLATADVQVNAMSMAAWSSLAMLTANALVGSRAVLAVGVVAVAQGVVTAGLLAQPPRMIAEVAFFLASSAAAVFVYARHRDARERARQARLREQNAELEELRATLERRVEDRTRALARTAAELKGAYDDLRANQELLLRNEKMVAMGRLTAAVAHELATPLSALLATIAELDELRQDYAHSIGDPHVGDAAHRAIADQMDEALGIARAANETAVSFVRGIRAHTRDSDIAAVEVFDAAATAAEAARILGCLARVESVQLRVEAAEPVLVEGVPSGLSQVVTNLVRNAIDAIAATRRAGVVSVSVVRDGAQAVLRVIDDGPGIAADVFPRIFEPLFTTKPYGEGTGLGLAIVSRIVREQLAGEIDVTTGRGTGTTFVVRVPVAARVFAAHDPAA